MADLQLQYPGVLLAAMVLLPVVIIATWRSRAGLSRLGRRAALVFRCAWVLVCIFALASPSLRKQHTDRLPTRVILLEDRSSSVAASTEATAKLRRELLDALGDRAPHVEMLFAGKPWRADDSSVPSVGDETDIEAALDAANAETLDAAGRVILMTDGRATRGNAVDAAARLALRGVSVHTVPIGRREHGGPDIVLSEPPVDARVGLPAALRVTMSSPDPARVNLALLDSEGKVLDRHTLRVAGRQTCILRFTPERQGVQTYRIQAQAPEEGAAPATPADQDSAIAIETKPVPVYVQGPPRILLADNFPEELDALRKSLEPLKIPIDTITPDQWPSEKELGNYAAVILSDFSGRELSDEQRERLRVYVEQQGCGLLFIGGGNVLPSRWKQNPLGQLLPVVLDDKPADLIKKRPEASVVFVLDRSGSMGNPLAGPAAAGQISKLDLVKAATIASIQSLPDSAHVAVIAFDDRPQTVVDPTPVTKKDEISRKVDSIGLGGGTVIDPAAREGLRLLAQMPGDKYMILLTDGRAERPGTDTGYWGDLAKSARKARVSLTTIAVGGDADQQMLEFMAQEARGKYFFCDTADKIPKVFVQQAKSIKRIAEQKERPFKPRPGPAADRLKGLAINDLPELEGRVRAKPRAGADIVLLSGAAEPLMASWQFGLGRVVAFTSDAKSAWGREWAAWAGYSSFWQQTVQSIMRIESPLHVRVRTYQDDGKVIFNYAVTDEKGNPATALRTGGTLSPGPTSPAQSPAAATLPSTSPSPISWTQPGPGEYKAAVEPPAGGGSYLAEMTLTRTGDSRAVHYTALVTGGRPAELAATGADMPALRSIADAGHGICSTVPADIVAACDLDRTRTITTRSPLWPALIVIALLMWPVDLAIRKFL